MTEVEVDTDVDNYTRDELLDILHLSDDASNEQIRWAVAKQVSRFRTEGKTKLAIFFGEIQARLFEEGSDALADESGDDEVTNWMSNQFLEGGEDESGPVPSRKNMTTTFSNEHMPMKQKILGIQQTYNVAIAQGENNPNLVNTLTRTLVVDSKLRDNIFPHFHEDAARKSSASQFNISMSNPLKNCLSLVLTSVTVPKTWYNIESGLGTNIFWVNNDPIYIASGYYDASGLADAITIAAAYPTTPLKDVTFDTLTGKFSFNFVNLLPSPVDVSLVFWSRSNSYNAVPEQSGKTCSKQQVPATKVDYNLGYFMGYREYDGEELAYSISIDIAPNNSVGLEAEAVFDLEGTKNIYISVEDYNQNRLNNQILTMAQEEKRIIAPQALAPTDLSFTCLPGVETPYYLPSNINAQSGLTQAQIYSINAIAENQNIAKDRIIGPQQANILGIIPVESFNVPWGRNIVASASQLQTNKRIYFGPVDINRLTIKLIDDVGNTVNLRGRDWTFTAEVVTLYQY